MTTNAIKASAYNADMLEAIFVANNWKELEIICPDGAVVMVSPCFYGEVPTRETVEYYLVYSEIPWNGCDSLEKLAKQLNNHSEDMSKLEASRKDLREYFESHEKSGWSNDAWSYYSDWHKDLYGYRPHGHVCGVYVEPYKGAYLGNRYADYMKQNIILCD